MKKLTVLATAMLALGGVASADIQAPPGSTYTATRKLGRGLSNILYGFMEIPEQIVRRPPQPPLYVLHGAGERRSLEDR